MNPSADGRLNGNSLEVQPVGSWVSTNSRRESIDTILERCSLRSQLLFNDRFHSFIFADLSPNIFSCQERCFSRHLIFKFSNCLAESSTNLTARRTSSILVPSLIPRDSPPLVLDPISEPRCSSEQACCTPPAVALLPCRIPTNPLLDPTAPNVGSDGVVTVASLKNPSILSPITSSLLFSRS